MKRLVRIIGSLALVVVFAGCATPSHPVWMDRAYDAVYDEKTYLVAVGSGSTREQAVDAARSALSQIFTSTVHAFTEVTSLSTAATDSEGKRTFTEAVQMIDTGQIESQSDAIIGSEVANVYTDSLGRVHARVVMHRVRSTELYRSRVDELRRSRAAIRSRSMLHADPLYRYVSLLSELALALEEQGYLDQIQVLTTKSQPNVVLPLRQELSAVAASIAVAVSLDGDETAQLPLTVALESELQRLGFTVVPGEAPYSLTGRYTAEEVVMEGSPYHYARYSLALQLHGERQTYLSKEVSSREAALSSSDAMDRALYSATGDGVRSFFALLLQTIADES
jgi:hypothetical protein